MGRSAWGLALAWIIFACARGYGGPIDLFLSWGFWAPLAKITYSCYLIHFGVINWTLSMPSYRVLAVQPYLVFRCIGNVCVAMFFGLVMVGLFESPMMHLEKLLFAALGMSRMPKIIK